MTGSLPFDELFGDDYRFFFNTRVSPAVSDQDAETICRALQLCPGSSVLEVGSGDGRLTQRLANRGFCVTGVDASASMIAEAQRQNAEAGMETVEYIHGDARYLNLGGSFDAAYSWFTSFGFHDEADDRRILANVANHLRPGGFFAIDVVDKDFFLYHFVETMVVEREDCFMIDRLNFDSGSGRLQIARTFVRGGVRRMEFSMRLFRHQNCGDGSRMPVSAPLSP